MNDNYLWDRSGEPDAEIQELEELLGELRYQPRPLEIPDNLEIPRRRRPFFLPVTIAAAIIMVAILSALWFQFNRTPSSPPIAQDKNTPVAPVPNVKQPESSPAPKSMVVAGPPQSEQKPRRQLNRNLVATSKQPATKREAIHPQLTAEQQAEKEQIVLALRMVSTKLNLAQRKVHDLPQKNLFRNQSKIG